MLSRKSRETYGLVSKINEEPGGFFQFKKMIALIYFKSISQLVKHASAL